MAFTTEDRQNKEAAILALDTGARVVQDVVFAMEKVLFCLFESNRMTKCKHVGFGRLLKNLPVRPRPRSVSTRTPY